MSENVSMWTNTRLISQHKIITLSILYFADKVNDINHEISRIFDDIKRPDLSPEAFDNSLKDLIKVVNNISNMADNLHFFTTINMTYYSSSIINNILEQKSNDKMNANNHLERSNQIIKIIESMSKIINKKHEQNKDIEIISMKISCTKLSILSKYSEIHPNKTLIYKLNNVRLKLPLKFLNKTDQKISVSSSLSKKPGNAYMASTASIIDNDNVPLTLCNQSFSPKFISISPVISLVIGNTNISTSLNDQYLNLM